MLIYKININIQIYIRKINTRIYIIYIWNLKYIWDPKYMGLYETFIGLEKLKNWKDAKFTRNTGMHKT